MTPTDRTASTPLPCDLDALLALARQAGEAIMAVYEQDFDVYDKADQSPLTEADLTSHRVIVEGLGTLCPDVPVLSEESHPSVAQGRLQWPRYWLIDPLDGTKEFIKKNGEFTVNIALIEAGEPVFGVVYAPALQVLYWGGGQAAFKQVGVGHPEAIAVSAPPADNRGWRVVGSRSHQSEAFREFVRCFEEADIVSMGSSLKLCLVAEGAADLYPRLGPTSEWDTAAAHAVVAAAGGQVLQLPELTPLRYNSRPDTLLNPFFVVCAAPRGLWTEAL